MKEDVINGIKYCLDEDKLTAEVIDLREDFELDETKLTAEKPMKTIFNGYEGDIIIPEVIVYNELYYRVTSIGESAFAGCYSLGSVTIPDSVTSIGAKAFEDCKSLKSIAIPECVTSIGDYAFLRCESLTSSVEIGEVIIGGINYLLYCNRTAKVIPKNGGYKGDIIIPNTIVSNEFSYRVTSIGTEAFAWCESLKSVVIPAGVTSIGERAFYLCTSLTNVAVPNSVTSIGERAFENCKKLTSVIIPEGIKSIGKLTFSECFALTEIVIPDSVTSIGYEAFGLCFSLKSIVIPARVTEIGERAFVGCSALTSIIVAEGNPRYDSRENCNAIIETATNTLIQGCSQTIIPESVTEIGEESFASCNSLISIVIPEGVTSIGGEAFRNCGSLKSITIPASVKSIGIMAFDWCESLKSITFEGVVEQWAKIELGNCWAHEISSSVIHCNDGDVDKYKSRR